MEGFVQLRLPRWKRILITRSIAIMPTVILAAITDIQHLTHLNDYLNILQSMMLPFALLPILLFTSSASVMGSFKSHKALVGTVWGLAVMVFGINIYLVVSTLMEVELNLGLTIMVCILYFFYSLVVIYFLFDALRFKWITKIFGENDIPVNAKKFEDETERSKLVGNEHE